VRSASVVVLPYDSPDQVTSGVLVDAIAAGRPVIATAFPHAVELLSDGAGIIVPHREPVALAAAIRTALCEPGVLEAMTTRARELAPSLGWPTVAAQYRALTETVTSTAVAAAT
jgi:glycosyltransferase involved in cell wall biosynthesis